MQAGDCIWVIFSTLPNITVSLFVSNNRKLEGEIHALFVSKLCIYLLFTVTDQCATVEYKNIATSGQDLETVYLSSDRNITVAGVQAAMVRSGCYISGYTGNNITVEDLLVSIESVLSSQNSTFCNEKKKK